MAPDSPASAKKPKGSGLGKQYVPPASIVTPPRSAESTAAPRPQPSPLEKTAEDNEDN